MKTATPLTAAITLFALAACGDDTSTEAKRPAQQSKIEKPAPPAEPVKIAETEPVATPEPELIDAVIAFRGEDGELALERDSLEMASTVHDADNDVWSVFIKLDAASAEKFYTLTTKTTGEALSIVVEDMVVSTPVLENPVYGGGFVFDVDNGEAASAVVAALTGQEQVAPAPVEIAAEEALPGDEVEDAVANVNAEAYEE